MPPSKSRKGNAKNKAHIAEPVKQGNFISDGIKIINERNALLKSQEKLRNEITAAANYICSNMDKAQLESACQKNVWLRAALCLLNFENIFVYNNQIYCTMSCLKVCQSEFVDICKKLTTISDTTKLDEYKEKCTLLYNKACEYLKLVTQNNDLYLKAYCYYNDKINRYKIRAYKDSERRQLGNILINDDSQNNYSSSIAELLNIIPNPNAMDNILNSYPRPLPGLPFNSLWYTSINGTAVFVDTKIYSAFLLNRRILDIWKIRIPKCDISNFDTLMDELSKIISDNCKNPDSSPSHKYYINIVLHGMSDICSRLVLNLDTLTYDWKQIQPFEFLVNSLVILNDEWYYSYKSFTEEHYKLLNWISDNRKHLNVISRLAACCTAPNILVPKVHVILTNSENFKSIQRFFKAVIPNTVSGDNDDDYTLNNICTNYRINHLKNLQYVNIGAAFTTLSQPFEKDKNAVLKKLVTGSEINNLINRIPIVVFTSDEGNIANIQSSIAEVIDLSAISAQEFKINEVQARILRFYLSLYGIKIIASEENPSTKKETDDIPSSAQVVQSFIADLFCSKEDAEIITESFIKDNKGKKPSTEGSEVKTLFSEYINKKFNKAQLLTAEFSGKSFIIKYLKQFYLEYKYTRPHYSKDDANTYAFQGLVLDENKYTSFKNSPVTDYCKPDTDSFDIFVSEISALILEDKIGRCIF